MPVSVLVEKKKLKNPPLDLHFLGDRVLRQPTKRITKIDDEIRLLVRQMLQTMYSADGVGLAAPQVGVHKQLIIIDIDPAEASNQPIILINPVIKQAGTELEYEQEGCLSIPNVYLEVLRPKAIEVTFKDLQSRPQTLKADGFLARAIQHEMDHLNGVLFVDRVENPILLNQELKKHGFSTHAVQSLV